MSGSRASLQLLQTKGLGTVTLRRLLLKLAAEERPIEDFVAASQSDNISHYGIKPEIARGIEATYDQAKAIADKLEQAGIETHSIGSSTYPVILTDVLGDTAPPLLFTIGNMAILAKQGVGFCGSRKASAKGLQLAAESAATLANHDYNVISGYANGVDLAAHRSALEAGGVTTCVLAEGILRFRKKPEIATALGDGEYLIISEFPPSLGWIARNAMQRNRTIVGLSSAVIVIEAGPDGGTFAAGETALKLHRPLYVVEYAHPEPSAAGNVELLDRGAHALRGDQNGRPNLMPLLQTLEQTELAVRTNVPQVRMRQTTRTKVSKQKVVDENHSVAMNLQTLAVQLPEKPAPVAEAKPLAAPTSYRKKLIEVALPLEAINKESAREKSIRHGHPSTLHLWWARRPLATCRAVLFASLVDDPGSLPEDFPTEGAQEVERQRLFRLIEQLVIWENSDNEAVLHLARIEIARSAARNHDVTLPKDQTPTQVAEALRRYAPPVLDPFAGGGSIPLEAQRLGLEAHASDLNPVAVLINKAMIEIPPKFAGQPPINPEAKDRIGAKEDWHGARGLAADVRYYGKWMCDRAFERIGHLYPKVTLPKEYGSGEATVIAWLWARTVTCPNPACGAIMPLISSYELSKKEGRHNWVEPVIDQSTTPPKVSFIVKTGKGIPSSPPKLGRGAKFRCLCCDQATTEQYIKDEGMAKRMGEQLMAVIAEGNRNRLYLTPTAEDVAIALNLNPTWIPNQSLAIDPRNIWCVSYGLTTFGDLFTYRQLIALVAFSDLVTEAHNQMLVDGGSEAYADAVVTYLAFSVDRLAESSCTLARWQSTGDFVAGAYARQALPMIWDYAEINPFSHSTRNFLDAVEWVSECFAYLPARAGLNGNVLQRDAATSMNGKPGIVISTDPPYYDNIGYSDLADYFYIWLRRSIGKVYPDTFATLLTPKSQELVATPYRFEGSKKKADAHFESGLEQAFHLMRDIGSHHFPLTIYYAFKQAEEDSDYNDNSSKKRTTSKVASTGWETMLEGLIHAGFVVDGTWPMRTERGARSNSLGANALASSIVLVCRPRAEGAPLATRRDFLNELRRELPGALKNLQRGNVAPVDFAQAAIGPGMAVYSRYSKIVEANGDRLGVRTALQLINQELDKVLTEQESEYDAGTRWAVAWYEQYGHNDGPSGDADVLARAKDTAVARMVEAEIIISRAGKTRLVRRDEMPANWQAETQTRLTVWGVTQHLIRALQDGGDIKASAVLRHVGGLGEIARDLAYRLYSTCERKGWSQDALAYNSLVIAWPELQRQSSTYESKPQQARFGED